MNGTIGPEVGCHPEGIYAMGVYVAKRFMLFHIGLYHVIQFFLEVVGIEFRCMHHLNLQTMGAPFFFYNNVLLIFSQKIH